MSVKAMKSGTVEFLTQSFRQQELLDAVPRSLSRDRTSARSSEALLNCESDTTN
jgi:FixJ family two-component response regulator